MRAWQSPTPLRDRFDAKWMPEPNSGCWLWTAYCNTSGYGQVSIGARHESRRMAHRVSWELHRGPIPDGISVLHKCDVPACVNPDHLFLGTQADNVADCVSKGRMAQAPRLLGSAHAMSKLTEAAVVRIRATRRNTAKLAAELNVTTTAIKLARARKTWRHVA